MHVFMDIHDYISQTKKISQMCMLACMFIREKRERGRGTEGGRERKKVRGGERVCIAMKQYPLGNLRKWCVHSLC